MSYERFKKYIQAHIKRYLPPEYGNVEVKVERQTGNNGVKTDVLGFSIEGRGTLWFGLMPMYEAYQRGDDVAHIMRNVAESYLKFNEQGGVVPAKNLSYDAMKNNIFVSARNIEMNQEILPYIPHEIKDGLAFVYMAHIQSPNEGRGTILLNYSHLNAWGITEETLKEKAWENMRSCYCPELIDMDDLMCSILGRNLFPDECFPDLWYVLTNQHRHYGAAYAFDEKILEQIGNELGADFFVLPSTVHETILIKNVPELRIGYDLSGLSKLVKMMNREAILPEEVLSDEVYQYSRESHKLTKVVEEPEQGMTMTM